MATAKPNATMARFIDKRIVSLSGRKTQKDIADQGGYANQNMISFLKNGNAKVSYDRVIDLANALEVDPAHLFRLTIQQFVAPEAWPRLEPLLTTATKNELEILQYIRELSGEENPKLNDRMKKAIEGAFDKPAAEEMKAIESASSESDAEE